MFDQIMTSWLDEAPFFQAIVYFLVLNLAMSFLAVLVGLLLYWCFPKKQIQTPQASVSRKEIGFGLVTVVLNVGITAVGLSLYRAGWINLPRTVSWKIVLDLLLFLWVMDAMMYFLHRVAHSRFFRAVHRLHHRYENPNAASLFVLHPLETIGFGSLWSIILLCYDFSLWAVMFYTGLNLVFGVIGHLGLELFPHWWVRCPLTRWITTSTFHNQHHAETTYNLGFYTTVWDTFFGTLHPQYKKEFTKNAALLSQAKKLKIF